MENEGKDHISLRGIVKSLGPGILYAGAAIGASHLVQSTRAGAHYGFKLIWVIILINLFKYPFFEFGYRYTAAIGENMLVEYRKLGRWVIVTFFGLMVCTGVVNVAAITIVTTGLTLCFFNIRVNPFLFSFLLLGAILVMLLVGRYAMLDRLMKIMIAILSLLSVITFVIAVGHHIPASPGYVPPPVWDQAGIAFLIALMGWMPTPIEASVFPSLWAQERRKQTRYRPKFREALVDFHVGYIGSKVVTSKFIPQESYPRKWLRIWGLLGIVFLSGFSLIFLASRIGPLI